MSASLVGSEMCIRDSPPPPSPPEDALVLSGVRALRVHAISSAHVLWRAGSQLSVPGHGWIKGPLQPKWRRRASLLILLMNCRSCAVRVRSAQV
eukprot:15465630-Alexandrium_andersonii.AAC.1